MTTLKRFGISIGGDLIERFDRWCRDRGYENRSEAVRDLIRDRLVQDDWRRGRTPSVGTLTLVYDHHVLELPRRLTEIQHAYEKLIVSTIHVHLDHCNCLEVIIFKGPGKKIQEAGDRLMATKGVKHSTLSLTTTGKGL